MTDLIPLHDPTTGATAKILPARGFNCFSYQPVVQGEPVEVLWTAPDFVTGQSKASHSGIPIMFPFAGRLRARASLRRPFVRVGGGRRHRQRHSRIRH